MVSEKLQAGSELPRFLAPKVRGIELNLGSGQGWQMLVAYRGKHLPHLPYVFKKQYPIRGR